MKCVVETGLSNYYGEVCVYQCENKYYLALEDYDHELGMEISEELALLMINEFKIPKEIVGISRSEIKEL